MILSIEYKESSCESDSWFTLYADTGNINLKKKGDKAFVFQAGDVECVFKQK